MGVWNPDKMSLRMAKQQIEKAEYLANALSMMGHLVVGNSMGVLGNIDVNTPAIEESAKLKGPGKIRGHRRSISELLKSDGE